MDVTVLTEKSRKDLDTLTRRLMALRDGAPQAYDEEMECLDTAIGLIHALEIIGRTMMEASRLQKLEAESSIQYRPRRGRKREVMA